MLEYIKVQTLKKVNKLIITFLNKVSQYSGYFDIKNYCHRGS